MHKKRQIGPAILLDFPVNRAIVKYIEDSDGPVIVAGEEGSQSYNVAPRRHKMATAMEMKEKAYFEDVYKELEGIKMKIYLLRESLARTYGTDSPMLIAQDRHLVELVEYVDWKLQVLEKGTAFDWKTSKGIGKDIQSEVSVNLPERTGPEISSGYLGG
jgi:hypothetical protein